MTSTCVFCKLLYVELPNVIDTKKTMKGHGHGQDEDQITHRTREQCEAL
jgi:hypothetical protein